MSGILYFSASDIIGALDGNPGLKTARLILIKSIFFVSAIQKETLSIYFSSKLSLKFVIEPSLSS